MKRPKQRIGLMGGTFDPIHIGHLVTAEEVRNQFELEKVIFIPAGHPPHKMDSQVTAAEHRYQMTQLATESNPNFIVSTIELERTGPSFTSDTLRHIVKAHGEEADFYFIIGADSLAELHTWNEVGKLLDLCHFVAATRPGIVYSFATVLNHFGETGHRRIHQLVTPELAISSTDIRERVRSGRSIQYIVPDAVKEYIERCGLYQEQ